MKSRQAALRSQFHSSRVGAKLALTALFLCISTVFGTPAAHAVIPLGSEFQVNSFAPNPQGRPAVAADGSGGLIIVWDSVNSPGSDHSGDSIQGQRYAASGSPLGGQFQVNSFAPSQQNDPAVAADAAGNLVVVWSSTGSLSSDQSSTSIQAQRRVVILR